MCFLPEEQKVVVCKSHCASLGEGLHRQKSLSGIRLAASVATAEVMESYIKANINARAYLFLFMSSRSYRKRLTTIRQ